MKRLLLLTFTISTFGPSVYALDPSRLINELNYLRESSSLVKEVETSSDMITENSSEESNMAPLDEAEIVNIEAEYFTDEISTKKAAPKRSR